MSNDIKNASTPEDDSTVAVQGQAAGEGRSVMQTSRSRRFAGQRDRWRHTKWNFGILEHVSGESDTGELTDEQKEHRRRTERWVVSGAVTVIVGSALLLLLLQGWREHRIALENPAPNAIKQMPQTPAGEPRKAATATAAPTNPSVQAPLSTPALQLVAAFQSSGGPLPGQESRASQNGSLRAPPGSTQYVWKVTQTPTPKWPTFALIHDVSFGSDEAELTELKDGSVTAAKDFDDVYIARVQGASGPLTEEVYAR